MPSRDVHVDDACRRITQHITLEGLSIVTRLTEPIGPKNSRMHSTPAPADLIGGSNCQNTSALRKFLDAVPSIRIIHIQPLRDRIGHQPCGGRLAEARKLRDFIRERKLVTYIGPPGPPPAMLAIGLRDTPCAAACRVAFMGGAQRFMAPEAKLGFHRGSFPGITDEELAQEDEELVQENEARSRGLFGVWVRAWFANRAEPTAGDSMWWLTSEELRQAGVITGVASLNDLEVWLRQGTL